MAANYDATSRFYAQRQEMFVNNVLRQLEISEQEFNQELTIQLTKYITLVRDRIIEAVERAGEDINQITMYPCIDDEFQIYIDEILPTLTSTNIRNVAAKIGQNFEQHIPDLMQKAMKIAASKKGKVIDDGFNYLFSFLGDAMDKAAVTGGVAKQIRTDALIYSKGMKLDRSTGRLTTDKGEISQELQEWVSAKKQQYVHLSKIEALQDYLNLDAYGQNIKIWNYNSLKSRSKEFASSKALRDRINETQSIYDSSKPQTWSTTFARTFVNWQISKDLINIINPVNTIFIAGNTVRSMSEVIDESTFYIKINPSSVRKPAKEQRGGGLETHPWIDSTSIMIRAKNQTERILYQEKVQKRQSAIQIQTHVE